MEDDFLLTVAHPILIDDDLQHQNEKFKQNYIDQLQFLCHFFEVQGDLVEDVLKIYENYLGVKRSQSISGINLFFLRRESKRFERDLKVVSFFVGNHLNYRLKIEKLFQSLTARKNLWLTQCHFWLGVSNEESTQQKFRALFDEVEHLKLNSVSKHKSRQTIAVTATMSAGKSSVINALVANDVALVRNQSTTARITHILRKKQNDGHISFFKDGHLKVETQVNTDIQDQDNTDIYYGTYFDWCETENIVELVDTPGVNSAIDADYAKVTEEYLKQNAISEVLYVMNVEQLETDDDIFYFKQIAKQEHKVIIALNKIDSLDDDEHIKDVIDQLQSNGRL